MKVLKVSFLFIIIFIGIISFVKPSFSDWIIDGNKVYVNDSNVFISATPHTIYDEGYIYFNLTSKIYNGDADVVFGFNTTEVKPESIELYKPQEENITINYTCSGNYFNYTLSPNHFWCYNNLPQVNNETNETIWIPHLIFDHSFESGNIPTKTASWNETRNLIWKDYSNGFSSINLNYQNMTKWYFFKNIPINSGTNYYFRIKIDMVPKFNMTEGKYWFAIKPSGETLSEAISTGHLYALDPWWNNSWYYKKQINITEDNGLTLYNYGVNVTIDTSSLVSAGKLQADCDDIRFLNSTEDGVFNWKNLTNCNTSTTIFQIKLDLTKSTKETIYMYYGNPSASAPSYNTELFWDSTNYNVSNQWYNVTFLNSSGQRMLPRIHFKNTSDYIRFRTLGGGDKEGGGGTFGASQYGNSSLVVRKNTENNLTIDIGYDVKWDGGNYFVAKVNETWEFVPWKPYIKITVNVTQINSSGDFTKGFLWGTAPTAVNHTKAGVGFAENTTFSNKIIGTTGTQVEWPTIFNSTRAWASWRNGEYFGLFTKDTLPATNISSAWAVSGGSYGGGWYNGYDGTTYGTGIHIHNINKGDVMGPLTYYITFDDDNTDNFFSLEIPTINTGSEDSIESDAPNLTLINPTGTKDQTIGIYFNVTATERLSFGSCYYWVTKGAVTEVTNTSTTCVNASDGNINGTFTVSEEATYIFHLFVNDTLGNANVTTSSFIVDIPSGSPGAGGGAIIIQGGGANWSMQTDQQNTFYEFSLLRGTPREKGIRFENFGETSRRIKLLCEGEDLCDYLEFQDDNFELPLAKGIKTRKTFIIDVPEDFEKGEYIINLIAIDDIGNRGVITSTITVSGLNFITWFIKVGTGLNIVWFISMVGAVTLLFRFTVFRKVKNLAGIYAFLIGLFAGIILIIFI